MLNLLVLRSKDIDRAITFYHRLGLSFQKHQHGKGLEHYASEQNGSVFEIYPQTIKHPSTSHTRIGFAVMNVDATIESLEKLEVEIISPPKDSEWGRRAVVKDLDGHHVEITES